MKRTHDTSPLARLSDAELERLAALLAPKVASILAAKLAAPPTPADYTSRLDEGPPGVPDREWKKIARRIGRLPYPGARWYVVERQAYESWLGSARSSDPSPQSSPAPIASREPWSPAVAAREAGLRVVGGRGR